MESISERHLKEVARLVEVTSDAVSLCQLDGTILHVNRQLLTLLREEREDVVGSDIKDLLFSGEFERAAGHRLPFTLDGTDNALMLKLAEGSFIPVRVRAVGILPKSLLRHTRRPQRVLVCLRSMEEEVAHDRQTQRLMAELRSANRRLSGTLSVIMAAVGAEDMPTLLDTVLNKLTETLEADGAAIYLSENGGFKLRGASQSLSGSYLPDFVPFGAGISTHVLRAGKSCRLSVVPTASRGAATATFYDMDARTSGTLRMRDTPPFRTLIAVPVFFGTQVLGIMEMGWHRPTTPRMNDARVLEVVGDYLSIQLVSLASSLRAERSAELNRSLNRLRELLFAGSGNAAAAWGGIMGELRQTLSCRLCPVVHDRLRGRHVIDFGAGGRVDVPGSIDETFFSTKVPAPLSAGGRAGEAAGDEAPSLTDLKTVRIVRVDRTTWMGEWLYRRGLPCQGVFLDLGPNVPFEAADVDAAGGHAQGEGAPETGLARRADASPHRMFLLVRDGSQEPIDNAEFDYLVHLAHDYERITAGERRKESDHHIAQALQAGMRSTLRPVPGITTDSLYSSATKQALVGGDFYTLIRLPDDRAVMILGDVSGKGVEAASMSAMAKTALTAYAWEGAGPASLARSLNRMLMGFSRVETFVTMFVAKLDLASGVGVYCSAGHPPTMLVHPPREGGEAGEVELLAVQSGVVGAFDTMSYESGSFSFAPGDILFMYTDGAIEARDPAGAFFGEQRLRDEVLRASANGVHGLCEEVLERLDGFSHGALDDDIALVALRFDGLGGGADDGSSGD